MLTAHLHLVPRSKNAWNYTSTPPIRLHGVVLSYKKAQGQLYLCLTLTHPLCHLVSKVFNTVFVYFPPVYGYRKSVQNNTSKWRNNIRHHLIWRTFQYVSDGPYYNKSPLTFPNIVAIMNRGCPCACNSAIHQTWRSFSDSEVIVTLLLLLLLLLTQRPTDRPGKILRSRDEGEGRKNLRAHSTVVMPYLWKLFSMLPTGKDSTTFHEEHSPLNRSNWMWLLYCDQIYTHITHTMGN